MSTLSLERFLVLASEWAARRNTQFQYNWPVKGGWEGWIQVDLTAFVLSQDSTIDILREQPIFSAHGQRVDLLLNADRPVAEQVPVELKAQSFENRHRFVAAVHDDIHKIGHDLDTAHRSCACIVLVFAFEQAGLDEVLAIQIHQQPIFSKLFVGEVAIAYAIRTLDGWQPATVVTPL